MEILQLPRRVLTEDEIFDLVREDLRDVEKAIALESAAAADSVRPISKYLQQNGGEHLRAAVLLMCARFAGCTGSNKKAIQLGAVVEMLHAATLVHGGILDAQRAGRGQAWPSIQRANSTCVLGGDWLYLCAFRAALRERVLHLVIGVAQMKVMARLIQPNRIGLTEVEYMDLVDHKSAGLFRTCGILGAAAAGVDESIGEKLGEFAWNLGMAFQLVDDILDCVSLESRRHEPARSGLTEERITLPLVYALEQATASERNLVDGVLRNCSPGALQFTDVLTLVDRYGAIERTRARARQFTDRARQIVGEFPDSSCSRALLALTI